MTLENSIADIVHQYVELFFRSEILQMYCLKWSYLLKKLLLGVWYARGLAHEPSWIL
jgi:hypothetical protein